MVMESMEIEVRLTYEGGFIYCRSLHLHEYAKWMDGWFSSRSYIADTIIFPHYHVI